MEKRHPLAAYAVMADLAYVIYEIDMNEERILLGLSSGGKSPRWHKVYYTSKGDAYIKVGNARIHMSEFYRI